MILSESDQKLLRGASQVSTEEIERDIAETLAEIAQMEREAEHLERTPHSLQSARWDHMRAWARRSGITERQAFVDKLKRVLELRAVSTEKISPNDR